MNWIGLERIRVCISNCRKCRQCLRPASAFETFKGDGDSFSMIDLAMIRAKLAFLFRFANVELEIMRVTDFISATISLAIIEPAKSNAMLG